MAVDNELKCQIVNCNGNGSIFAHRKRKLKIQIT